MATHYTNGDRILQAVFADSKLAELGEYTPTGDETVAARPVFDSENPQYVLFAPEVVDVNGNRRYQGIPRWEK